MNSSDKPVEKNTGARRRLEWADVLFRFFNKSVKSKIITLSAVLVLFSVSAFMAIASYLYILDSKGFVLAKSNENANLWSVFFRGHVEKLISDIAIAQKNPERASAHITNLRVIKGDSSPRVLFKKSSFDYELVPRFIKEARQNHVAMAWNPSSQSFQLALSTSDEADSPLIVSEVSKEYFEGIFQSDGLSQVLLFSNDGDILSQSLSQNTNWQFMADRRVPALLLQNANASVVGNGTVEVDVGGQDVELIGAYQKTSIVNYYIGVVFPKSIIYETPKKLAIYTGCLALAILALAFIAGLFFSNTLVRPIWRLVDGTKKVAEGDYEVKVMNTTNDEIAQLGAAFNQMVEGLKDRERIKNIFGKFHSAAISDYLMQHEEASLGGERLPVTVFFSDIRSFTATSENMQPEEVVGMLNEYFEEMVGVIVKHDGVVDKYVGDAIMAIWGAPIHQDPEVSALKAIEACLDMRDSLAVLNKKRAARGQKPIKIGMGIHSGEAIAGNIGSSQRMEYTVIGDTVNTASRVESSTKALGEDLLIHQSTKNILPSGKFQFSKPYSSAAKGKTDDLIMYGVKRLGQGEEEPPELNLIDGIDWKKKKAA